ncbi:transcriptional regulator [Spirochaetia bacterium]|nr:transcriptional regulator [Spirochaetia bacterium]
MGFKENLKAELTYSGMLVKELAALSGVNKHSIDNYLNTKNRMPSAEIAVKIARILGVSVEYLVTGRESPHKEVVFSPEMRLLLKNIEELDEKDRKTIHDMVQFLKNQKK